MIRRALILAALVFCAGALDGMFSKQERSFSKEEQMRAALKKAELHAAILAACFNGETLQVADDTIRCRRQR